MIEPVPQFNPQFHVLSCGEAVYVLQSIPKFSLQVSKPVDIVSPVEIEINRVINPTLYDNPLAPTMTAVFVVRKMAVLTDYYDSDTSLAHFS